MNQFDYVALVMPGRFVIGLSGSLSLYGSAIAIRGELLAKCPKCEARFKMPALWEYGRCDRCQLIFGEMIDY